MAVLHISGFPNLTLSHPLLLWVITRSSGYQWFNAFHVAFSAPKYRNDLKLGLLDPKSVRTRDHRRELLAVDLPVGSIDADAIIIIPSSPLNSATQTSHPPSSSLHQPSANFTPDYGRSPIGLPPLNRGPTVHPSRNLHRPVSVAEAPQHSHARSIPESTSDMPSTYHYRQRPAPFTDRHPGPVRFILISIGSLQVVLGSVAGMICPTLLLFDVAELASPFSKCKPGSGHIQWPVFCTGNTRCKKKSCGSAQAQKWWRIKLSAACYYKPLVAIAPVDTRH